jgi:hypothetical protein
MGEFPEVQLPNGQKATFDEKAGAYTIENSGLKQMEAEHLTALYLLSVKRLRQLVQVVFWAVVCLVVKASISIADEFDNYAAKPAAQNIAETFGFASSIFIMVLVLFIIGCLLWVFFGDFWNGVKQWQKGSELPAVQQKKKGIGKALKPIASSAQNILKSKK